MEPKTDVAFPDDILLRNWRYYIQGLPYTRLVDLLNEAVRMGLNVRPLHRFKEKRKWHIRKEIEDAFISSEQFQNRVHNTLKAYFCKNCGGRSEGYAGGYNKTFDVCTCNKGLS